ncbi:hypothetical protein BDZ97DRAFT_302522 [Flammula alnicola]|nr:hypothetical protein BDZ97DRAFT_302522 [Flammula alnicola]
MQSTTRIHMHLRRGRIPSYPSSQLTSRGAKAEAEVEAQGSLDLAQDGPRPPRIRISMSISVLSPRLDESSCMPWTAAPPTNGWLLTLSHCPTFSFRASCVTHERLDGRTDGENPITRGMWRLVPLRYFPFPSFPSSLHSLHAFPASASGTLFYLPFHRKFSATYRLFVLAQVRTRGASSSSGLSLSQKCVQLLTGTAAHRGGAIPHPGPRIPVVLLDNDSTCEHASRIYPFRGRGLMFTSPVCLCLVSAVLSVVTLFNLGCMQTRGPSDLSVVLFPLDFS